MNGLLIIDKPAGITSHDVVSRVRRTLKTKRVGHTGTLDPFATGVMVILVGQATRLAQFLDKDEKEYEALVRFGFETDTGDATGVRSAECGMRSEEIDEILQQTDWENIFSTFRGEIEQIPPMYSAKKIGGKKLYEHARKGEVIDRKACRITIHKLEMIDDPGFRIPHSTLRIRVSCSAGTYIRTLAEDIGRQVGTGAHLAELRRTRAGRFDLELSVTLDELDRAANPAARLIPMETAVAHLARFVVAADRADKTRNGLSSRVLDGTFSEGEPLQMVDERDRLIAIGFYNAAENTVQPKVVLV
jgi:tRNA pseudouridine55 synthase